jgi:hypothetical protein
MGEMPASQSDRALTIEQKVDRHIRPWKWSLALAFYFPFAQLLSALGAPNSGFASYIWIVFLMNAVTGALLGALLAMGARSVVKAIRC